MSVGKPEGKRPLQRLNDNDNIKMETSTFHAFFRVIPGRLKFICRRFGTLSLFYRHRQVDVSRMNTFLVRSTHIYLPMKMEQSVPKRRHINFRRWVITRKKAYKLQNPMKA